MRHWPLLAIGGIVIDLAGFAVGRAYPAHEYHQIGTTSYLYDTHSGKLCAPFRDSEVAYKKAAADDPTKRWNEVHPDKAASSGKPILDSVFASNEPPRNSAVPHCIRRT